MCKREFIRGEVYWADLPEIKNSKLQKGVRPIILLVNHMAGRYSPILQYIPLSTEIKREDLPVHVVLTSGGLKKSSIVLGEQLALIDTFRIGSKIGKISNNDMYLVETAAINQLGIDINSYIKSMKLQNNSMQLQNVC